MVRCSKVILGRDLLACEVEICWRIPRSLVKHPIKASLTLQGDVYIFRNMISKILFRILLVGTLVLLQFADCVAAFSQDQRTMQCCGKSSCTPANQSHNCCKTMTSTGIPRVLVKARVSLHVPIIAVVEHAPVLETAMFTPLVSLSFDPQEHSPPELYTLHRSLLI